MKEKIFNLTSSQEEILLTEKFFENTNINNICGTCSCNNKLNFKNIEKAINFVIEHNDSFRIRIIKDTKSYKQKIIEHKYEKIPIIELHDESKLPELEQQCVAKKIDIFKDKLYAFTIFKYNNGTGGFILNIHHLISDSWTLGITAKKILKAYISMQNNEEPEIYENQNYSDYIQSNNKYLKSDRFNKDKQYWESKFEQAPNIINLPTTIQSKDHISSKANRATFKISKSKAIMDFCKKHGCSPFNFFMTILGIYIYKVCHTNYFVIGTPILNRTNFNEKNTTGMFINIAPMKIEFEKEISIQELLHSITHQSMDLLRHQKYPYQNILTNIREKDPQYPSLFNVLLNYQITDTTSDLPIEYETHWVFNNNNADDLDIHLVNYNNDSKLSIVYDYKTNKFAKEDIKIMHSRILNIINQVISIPSISLQNVRVITKIEENKICQFNNTYFRYKKQNIPRAFEQIAKKYPNRIAVSDSNNYLTYDELNRKSNQLARKILELNLSSKVISFSLERSINIYITILAILKAGYTYMPIDPEYPINRINYMLENSTAELLISTKKIYSNFKYNKNIINFDNLLFDNNDENLNLEIPNNSLAYMMYTSGTTGTPKAVTIKHYNVINFTKSVQDILKYSEPTNIISVTTVCFDIFVFETFPTLLSGLTIHIANELESKSPELLCKFIKRNHITKLLTTPSRVNLLLEYKDALKDISCIEEFILGGEPLPEKLIKHLRKHTKAKIYDFYGPTETTVYSTYKDVTKSKIINIGKPIYNTKIHILDANNIEQPIGTVGEICISGDGVGGGYFNNEEKNAQYFVHFPFIKGTVYKTGDLGYWTHTGELICLGRKDNQIKIRGYRIELDDIANNILRYPGIQKCAVIDKNKTYICAYYVSEKPIDEVELKKHLVNLVPNYMIPNFFMRLNSLPLTVNHKIDKKALPEIDISSFKVNSKYVEPKTETEINICNAFKEILNIPEIGIKTDIFEYNLDSLEIIRIQTLLLKYDYKLNTQDFYQFRTIESIAKSIDSQNNQLELSESNSTYEKQLLKVNTSYNKLNASKIKIKPTNYNNILLLGATGYLGSHILNNLLENTNSHIYCIVRDKNKESSEERLHILYKFYFGKDFDTSRITIIPSNITKINLGLNDDKYNQLSHNIDLVINTVANVKYYGLYKDFESINVNIVKSLIDFCKVNNTHLCHISTLGVSGNYLVTVNDQQNNKFTENDFYIGQNYKQNVYTQTKFEAEKLIYEETKNGLNSTIMRVGNLTGRYSDGLFQKNVADNAFYNILRLIITKGILPNTLASTSLEFTPVDYCAKAICDIIANTDINKHVYHIFNNNYIAFKKFISILNELGYFVKFIPGNQFKKDIINVLDLDENKDQLQGVINDLDDELGIRFNSSVNLDNSITNAYLEKLDFHWPKITKDYIIDLINYMKKIMYI